MQVTDKSAPLKGHVPATKCETQEATTVGFATSLGSVEPNPAAAYLAPTHAAPVACEPHTPTKPHSGSLIPPASVVREQLEVNGKERRRLQKLLKLAEEQEGVGE